MPVNKRGWASLGHSDHRTPFSERNNFGNVTTNRRQLGRGGLADANVALLPNVQLIPNVRLNELLDTRAAQLAGSVRTARFQLAQGPLLHLQDRRRTASAVDNVNVATATANCAAATQNIKEVINQRSPIARKQTAPAVSIEASRLCYQVVINPCVSSFGQLLQRHKSQLVRLPSTVVRSGQPWVSSVSCDGDVAPDLAANWHPQCRPKPVLGKGRKQGFYLL